MRSRNRSQSSCANLEQRAASAERNNEVLHGNAVCAKSIQPTPEHK